MLKGFKYAGASNPTLSEDGVSFELEPVSHIMELLNGRLAPGYELLADELDSAPVARGAYALALSVESAIAFSWRTKTVSLPSGWYVYAGNANGPGGIRGRLRHHLRPAKIPHWHIDRLTNAALQIKLFAGIGGSECEIIARLSSSPDFHVPLVGFGSSDCRNCRSHLLRYGPPHEIDSSSPSYPRSLS